VGPVSVGAGVGLASVLTGDDAPYPEIGDALAIGAMVEWSNQ
jgi:tetrahydrodipicolinate N-succinyltransferase